MITATPLGRHTSTWQRELAAAITDPRELLAALDLDPELLPPALAASDLFRLRVPRAYVGRMRRGDPRDPLLRQVLPLGAELADIEGFVADPLGERDANRVPGLLHKYEGRALLVTTGACAVNCRYCFRREFPYDEQFAAGRWRSAIEALTADRSIGEVILSGGDPLALSDSRLAELTSMLEPIAHLRRLRIHTRTPIVLPSRVDAGLMAWLARLRWPATIVVHANHPRELDASVTRALSRLRAAGATLLNQSVLLRDVNDDVDVLCELSTALFDAGVLPYYLHLLDRVRGTSHFEVAEPRARALVGGMARRLSGYLVPRLAREQQGAPAKLVIGPDLGAGC